MVQKRCQIKKKIISHLKINVPTYKSNKLPDNPSIVQPFEIYEELRIEEIKKKHQI